MASRTPTSDPPASPAAAPASASLRRFFTSMVQTLRWRLLWVLALGFVGGIAAGVGLVMLVPLLDLVGVDAGGGSTGAIADAVSVALDRVGLRPSVPVLLSQPPSCGRRRSPRLRCTRPSYVRNGRACSTP